MTAVSSGTAGQAGRIFGDEFSKGSSVLSLISALEKKGLRPLIAAAHDTGAIALFQWHESAGYVEELLRTDPIGTAIASLRFSADGK